jgi:hypothetical protein
VGAILYLDNVQRAKKRRMYISVPGLLLIARDNSTRIHFLFLPEVS